MTGFPHVILRCEAPKDPAWEVRTLYYVYMLTNWNNKVLYTGVTNNLERRLYEHKKGLVDGFTKKYNVHKLAYFESTEDINSAIAREKQIKGWTRAKKNDLVEHMNKDWHDLSEDW
jgi:putative endonuclease